MNNEALITPIFKSMAVKNEAKTRKAGRPIFDDVEMVEIRVAGDRNFMPCYPAHSFWKNIDGVPHTYAQRWPEQYRRFKEGHAQAASGTPLEELPFLTQAKRSELKALSIYTAEALAMLDGKNLKTLGIGGRELKDQALAYLENAKGSADVTRLARENAALREEMERLRREFMAQTTADPEQESVPADADGDFASWEDDDLKTFIKDKAGAAPRGQPSHDTLVKMAQELEAA